MPEEKEKTEGKTGWSQGFATGLADNFDGFIALPEYGFREKYKTATGDLAPLLILTIRSDDYEDQEAGYSVGSGWKPAQDGKSIIHYGRDGNPDGKKALVGNAMAAKLIQRCEELGAGEVQKNLSNDYLDLAIWSRLLFHWKREVVTYDNLQKASGREPTAKLLPEKWLGAILEDGSLVTPEQFKANGYKMPAAGTPGGAATPDQAKEGFLAQVIGMAKALPDYTTFAQAILQLEAVKASKYPEIISQLYDSGPNGLFAKNHK